MLLLSSVNLYLPIDREMPTMTPDTRDAILTAARSRAQSYGYNGLSFRELAKDVGIKSASIHYYFPTKGDLGATLARLYGSRASADLNAVLESTDSLAARLNAYVGLFRKALEEGNRMCLCGIMAAEYDGLPDAVKTEVATFADLNIDWLTNVLGKADPPAEQNAKQWALAIYAAIGGAQLAARGRSDIAIFDDIMATYRTLGLIPA
jgi:TetR/AcrR family transcriptional repressor of nem operon